MTQDTRQAAYLNVTMTGPMVEMMVTLEIANNLCCLGSTFWKCLNRIWWSQSAWRRLSTGVYSVQSCGTTSWRHAWKELEHQFFLGIMFALCTTRLHTVYIRIKTSISGLWQSYAVLDTFSTWNRDHIICLQSQL